VGTIYSLVWQGEVYLVRFRDDN